MHSRPTLLLTLMLISASATAMSEKASKVQMLNRQSPLAASCQPLGTFNVKATDNIIGEPGAMDQASISAREKGAEMGGDTVIVLDKEVESGKTVKLRGTVLKCR